MDMERRFIPLTEARAVGDDDSPGLDGIASVYNQPSLIGDFQEQVAPGAFDDVLDNDVVVLFNHDADHVLGRTSAKTAELRDTDEGLACSVDLDDTAIGRDVYRMVKRGDVKGNSISFVVAEEEWDEEADPPLRTIKRFGELFDVGPVTHPAFEQTSVSARAEQRAREIRAKHVEPEEESDPERLRRVEGKLRDARLKMLGEEVA